MTPTTTEPRRARAVERPCCPANARPTLSEAAAEAQAARFRALADPTRLRMLSLLHNAAEEVCVCHIQEHFDLGQPTISHHLKVLREAGLVRCIKRGVWVYCRLDAAGVQQVVSALGGLSDPA